MNLAKRLYVTTALLVVSVSVGCHSKSSPTPTPEPKGEDVVAETTPKSSGSLSADQVALRKRVEPAVTAFCADCHAMPRRESSPAEEWEMEVKQGYALYESSGRKDLVSPPFEDTLEYFRAGSPEQLDLTDASPGFPKAPLSHRRSDLLRDRARPPGVTNVNWIDLGLASSPGASIVYCDIGTGTVNAYWPGKSDSVRRLSTLLQPVHVESCDLNEDGLTDLLVADIGEFNADDSDLGRVVWLRRSADDEKFSAQVIADGLSRVADARPGDFDGDGDTDVLVAAFGWRNSGQTLLLVNEGPGENGTMQQFVARVVDPRHGPVHVPPIDFDNDGDLDFISLLSQEHESVELFRNDGQGNFTPEVLWAAPDPAYGSSGIELADLDGDGDVDVLYTNGDSFDRGPKPHHSIQWLENKGETRFEHHTLCPMPGVLNATAGDFDADGDLDVIAAALLPPTITQKWKGLASTSIIMLVGDGKGGFEPHRVQASSHYHLSVGKGDFNGDGKLDFAVGNFLRAGDDALEKLVKNPELMIWESQ